MITSTIKNRIEYQFGKKIRYPKDCFALANEISKVCKENISPATLMRLFGLTKNNSQPRLFTLDVIAQYCGYSTWDDFLEATASEDLLINDKSKLKIEEIPDLLTVNLDEWNLKKLILNITEDNELEVCCSEISEIISRKLVDPLVFKGAYLIILDGLEKNATGILIKVDSAKLYPM